MEPNSNYAMGYTSTGTSVGTTLLGGTILDTYSSGIKTTQISQAFNLTPQNQIMQNKVAVFHVIRDEDEKIIKTEFIKELWVETKNGQSVDFQVARDSELADYDISELSIRVIYSVTF
jgi:DNA-binding transcriptional regulator of glucitol operon